MVWGLKKSKALLLNKGCYKFDAIRNTLESNKHGFNQSIFQANTLFTLLDPCNFRGFGERERGNKKYQGPRQLQTSTE